LTDRFRLVFLKSTTTERPSMDEASSPPGPASISDGPVSDREPSGSELPLSQTTLKQAKLDLMHPDPKIRMLAIRCLEKAEPGIALPLLQEVLADRDPEVRVQGLHSLVTFRDPSVFDLIGKYSNDEDSRIRLAVLRGLFKQKERIDLNLLRPFLSDESPWVRRKLATLLGWARLDGIFPILIRLSKDPHAKVRQAALFSLMALYPEENEDRLLEAMNDPDVDLRKWARDVLERAVRRSGKPGRDVHVGI
jgi:HEAT repeat protein